MSYAVSVVVGILSRAMKCATSVNLSITERISDFPAKTGKLVTESKEMYDHRREGMARGWSRHETFLHILL